MPALNPLVRLVVSSHDDDEQGIAFAEHRMELQDKLADRLGIAKDTLFLSVAASVVNTSLYRLIDRGLFNHPKRFGNPRIAINRLVAANFLAGWVGPTEDIFAVEILNHFDEAFYEGISRDQLFSDLFQARKSFLEQETDSLTLTSAELAIYMLDFLSEDREIYQFDKQKVVSDVTDTEFHIAAIATAAPPEMRESTAEVIRALTGTDDVPVRDLIARVVAKAVEAVEAGDEKRLATLQAWTENRVMVRPPSKMPVELLTPEAHTQKKKTGQKATAAYRERLKEAKM